LDLFSLESGIVFFSRTPADACSLCGSTTLESGSQLGYTSSGDPGPPLHLDPGVFSSPQEMFPQVKNLRNMNLYALAFVCAASVAVTLFAVVSFFMLNW
jgi:hypothetical protein